MPAKKLLSFKVTNTGCFEVDSHGFNSGRYPQLYINGLHINAHRHIWEECFGQIPPGLCVYHHCDNPACINPEHLFLGTSIDNTRDATMKGRMMKGEQHSQVKLTVEIVQEIRQRYEPYDKKNNGSALGREFGVHSSTIWSVINGRNWKWL